MLIFHGSRVCSFLVLLPAAGDLIGACPIGGTYNQGVIYEVVPPATAGGSWTEETLANFTDKGNGPGANPVGMPLGLNGMLYGALSTTKTGYGAVYEFRIN